MDDLVVFLRARLDEDESVARAADPELSNVFTRVGTFDPEMAADERHIMTHRPVRVLAEVEAKRGIVDRYAWLCEHGDTGGAAWVLRLLAAPYSSHPDFRPEWAPAA